MNNTPTNQQLFSQVAELITSARKQVRTAVNSTMVITYWNIGRLIVDDEQNGEQRAEYGKAVLKELGRQLTKEFGKGFDRSNLSRMRQFYMLFPNCDAVRHELSWTHFRLLIKVEKEQARVWYMNEAVNENWSTRALERQINSHYYERLISSQNKAPVKAEAEKKNSKLTPNDVLKDPYVLEFLQLKNHPSYSEKDLETALINELQNFLLELGAGFSFVARQKHFDLDGDHFYIDLVFYNYKLKCFILIDLKAGKLTHQDIGQMDTYIRIFEDQVCGNDDNPTIGLILCADKNEAVAKYSVLAEGEKIFASKYKLVLPQIEDLEAEIQKDYEQLISDK